MSLSTYKKALFRVEETNPKFDFPAWTFQQVKKPDRDIPNFTFYNKSVSLGILDVPTEKIVGTDHDAYNKLNYNWLFMLGNLERYKKTPYENIEKFAKGEYGVIAHYAKYGEEYYCFQEANHRTCLAKFSDIKSIKAEVTEFIFDSDNFKYHTCLKKLGFSIEKDKPEWLLGLSNGKFAIVNDDLIDPFIQYLQKYKISTLSSIAYKIKRYFTKEQPLYRFETKEHIKDLCWEIIFYQQKFGRV
ncbi:MAG: hypothetical protein FWG79_03580 [Bacteroidales bacterium]|nr:hypothetical protein [Bacteroidales bacterium]